MLKVLLNYGSFLEIRLTAQIVAIRPASSARSCHFRQQCFYGAKLQLPPIELNKNPA